KDIAFLPIARGADIGGEVDHSPALAVIPQRNDGRRRTLPAREELFRAFILLRPKRRQGQPLPFELGPKKGDGRLVGMADRPPGFNHEGWPGGVLQLERNVRLHLTGTLTSSLQILAARTRPLRLPWAARNGIDQDRPDASPRTLAAETSPILKLRCIAR